MKKFTWLLILLIFGLNNYEEIKAQGTVIEIVFFYDDNLTNPSSIQSKVNAAMINLNNSISNTADLYESYPELDAISFISAGNIIPFDVSLSQAEKTQFFESNRRDADIIVVLKVFNDGGCGGGWSLPKKVNASSTSGITINLGSIGTQNIDCMGTHTLTHEIGHFLGAGHQASIEPVLSYGRPQQITNYDPEFDGKYTLMWDFGGPTLERYQRINYWSNLEFGGQNTNVAEMIARRAPIIANFRPLPVNPPPFNISINGPSYIRYGERIPPNTWCAIPQGGVPPVDVTWYDRDKESISENHDGLAIANDKNCWEYEVVVNEYLPINFLIQASDAAGRFVEVNYGVQFTFDVSISGRWTVEKNTYDSWSVNASNGKGPYTYTWYRKNSGQSNYTQVGTGNSYGQVVSNDMTLKVVAKDDMDTYVTMYRSVTALASTGGPGCGPFNCNLPKVIPEDSKPEAYSLSNNYPNPFNPSTQIGFALPEQSNVELDVFNVMGQRVATLQQGSMSAGSYEITFDASTLPSGLYIARLTATGNTGEQFTQEIKMQLVK